MKNILFVLIVLVFVGCENMGVNGDDKVEDGIREEMIEQYDGGDRKVVVTYKGEGSDQEIIKRITYYSQNDGGGIMKEENYRNRKLDGLTSEYTTSGTLSYVYQYKDGELIKEIPPIPGTKEEINVRPTSRAIATDKETSDDPVEPGSFWDD